MNHHVNNRPNTNPSHLQDRRRYRIMMVKHYEGSDTALDAIISRMAVTMKDSGPSTACRAKVNFTMQVEKLLTKGTGHRTKSTVMASYTMKTLALWSHLITKISPSSGTTGARTKATSNSTRKMEMEH